MKKDWSDAAIEAFKEMVSGDKVFRMEVVDNKSPHSVVLYQVLQNLDLNINAKLVLDGFATSSGTRY